jgi:flagellar protein FliS
MNAPGLAAYNATKIDAMVFEATPHKLIDMLFTGAKEALVQALGALDRNDIEAKGKKLSKAVEILLHLQTILDKENGGDVAENLNELYLYMVSTLIDANRRNDGSKVEEVIGLLDTISDGWQSMPNEYKQ